MKMIQYFPKRLLSMLNLISLILQQKQILKNISHVDTLSFALKSNLASLETKIKIKFTKIKFS